MNKLSIYKQRGRRLFQPRWVVVVVIYNLIRLNFLHRRLAEIAVHKRSLWSVGLLVSTNLLDRTCTVERCGSKLAEFAQTFLIVGSHIRTTHMFLTFVPVFKYNCTGIFYFLNSVSRLTSLLCLKRLHLTITLLCDASQMLRPESLNLDLFQGCNSFVIETDWQILYKPSIMIKDILHYSRKLASYCFNWLIRSYLLGMRRV